MGAAAAAGGGGGGGESDSKKSGQSIDALLAAEVADLKDRKKQRFKWHDTGIKGTVFVEFPEDEGEEERHQQSRARNPKVKRYRQQSASVVAMAFDTVLQKVAHEP
jgi:hypothetical protein